MDCLSVALEYLDLVDQHPAPLRTVIFHIRRMCREMLDKYQLLAECCACKTTADVRFIVKRCASYRDGRERFVFNQQKEAEAKEAEHAKLQERQKRRDFEQRMVRKAKREGLDDLNFYLERGLKPPTSDDLEECKKCGGAGDARLSWWKERFSQHCFAFHGLATTPCSKGRGCPFLHVDVAAPQDPSWLDEKP